MSIERHMNPDRPQRLKLAEHEERRGLAERAESWGGGSM